MDDYKVDIKVILEPKQLHYNCHQTVELKIQYKRMLIGSNHDIERYDCKESFTLRNGVAIIHNYYDFTCSELELSNQKVDILFFAIRNRLPSFIGDVSFELKPLVQDVQGELIKVKLQKSGDSRTCLFYKSHFNNQVRKKRIKTSQINESATNENNSHSNHKHNDLSKNKQVPQKQKKRSVISKGGGSYQNRYHHTSQNSHNQLPKEKKSKQPQPRMKTPEPIQLQVGSPVSYTSTMRQSKNKKDSLKSKRQRSPTYVHQKDSEADWSSTVRRNEVDSYHSYCRKQKEQKVQSQNSPSLQSNYQLSPSNDSEQHKSYIVKPLNLSQIQTFRKQIPVPVPLANSPSAKKVKTSQECSQTEPLTLGFQNKDSQTSLKVMSEQQHSQHKARFQETVARQDQMIQKLEEELQVTKQVYDHEIDRMVSELENTKIELQHSRREVQQIKPCLQDIANIRARLAGKDQEVEQRVARINQQHQQNILNVRAEYEEELLDLQERTDQLIDKNLHLQGLVAKLQTQTQEIHAVDPQTSSKQSHQPIREQIDNNTEQTENNRERNDNIRERNEKSKSYKEMFLSERKKATNLASQVRHVEDQMDLLKLERDNLRQEKKEIEAQLFNAMLQLQEFQKGASHRANHKPPTHPKLDIHKSGSKVQGNHVATHAVSTSVHLQNESLKAQILGLQQQVSSLNKMMSSLIERQRSKPSEALHSAEYLQSVKRCQALQLQVQRYKQDRSKLQQLMFQSEGKQLKQRLLSYLSGS